MPWRLKLEVVTLCCCCVSSLPWVPPIGFVREPPALVDFSNSSGAILDCMANGVSPPTLTWVYADGEEAPDVTSLRERLSNGSLRFFSFAAQDYRQDVHAAVYRCKASNVHGAIVSRDVRVRAVVLQAYEAQVYDEFVIKGNTAVLKCHIPTFVADYVTVTSWLQGGLVIHPNFDRGSSKFAVLPSGELHISDVQPSDAHAAYRCHTKHRLTGIERPSAASGRLFVTNPMGSVPPRITDSKVTVTVHEGGSATLPCVAQGYPLPEVTWFVKGGDDNEDRKLVPIRSGGRFWTSSSGLRIERVATHDTATYVCVANNTVGSERAETTLQLTLPLSVTVAPSRRVVDLGQSASFRCVASGLPVGTITWLKNGRALLATRGRDILHVEHVLREDAGLYQCIASSESDSAQSVAQLALGDTLPVFHRTFAEIAVAPETRVSLQCVASGSPAPHVQWTHDNVEVDSRGGGASVGSFLDATSGHVVSSLNVSHVRPENGGHYACVASNKAGSVRHVARLNVFGRPLIRALPKISAVAGSSLTIACPASGYPLSGIGWERNGRPLPSSHHQVVFANGTLHVSNVQRSLDAGKYTCVARSSDGHAARRDFDVAVIVPPHVVPFAFADEYTLEGAILRLTCTVGRGDLPLTIDWTKDGGPVAAAGPGVAVSPFDQYSSILTIGGVTSSHNGNYTCVASNAAGSANHTARLVVNVPPRWVVEPQDAEILVGRRVVLDCSAAGFPQPVVEWMKAVENEPGEYEPPSASNPLVRHLDNGSLMIERVGPADGGQYLCRASNGVGVPLGRLAYLHVQVPVYFETRSTNQTARLGEHVQLGCEARGESPIRIEWFRNGVALKSMSRFVQRDHVMHVQRAERSDSATYTCVARNKFGHDEHAIHLTVLEPPESPGQLRVADRTSRSVTVAWTTPFDGHAAILNYVVRCSHAAKDKGGGGVTWPEVNVTVMAETATVAPLQPATSYHIWVIAVNALGTSDPSEAVIATTLEEAPGGPPLDLRAQALGADIVRVTWKPPKTDVWHGRILGYYVGSRPYETSDPYTFLTVDSSGVATSEPGVNLTQMRKFTRYGVVVQAFNQAGAGPRSDELVVLTSEDVPGSPPGGLECSALSSQSVHVSWVAMATDVAHGVLQGYKVHYRPVSEWYGDVPEVKITTGTKTVISGLGRYTNYSVQVLGFTRVGDGPRSDPVYCATNEDVPEAPGDIKVASVSPTVALISWRSPGRPNGVVTRYTIYERTTQDGKEEIEKHVVVAAAALPLQFELRDLTAGRRYEFWVTASTSLGEGQSTRVVSHVASGSSVVPAKVTAFSEKFDVAWKSVVTLLCGAVGDPPPQRDWHFRGRLVTSTSGRLRVDRNLNLVVNGAEPSDSGAYKCTAHNVHGRDEVNYVINVLVPPGPPTLVVTSTTFHSLQVHWKTSEPDSTTGSVTGYYLHFKRDYGEWDRVPLEADRKSHSLAGLDCGSRYHVYVTAVNRIGEGEPSQVVTARTEGSAPQKPRKHAFLRENSTFVSLHLEAWVSGCAILYFVIHYKVARSQAGAAWRLVSNNVLMQQREFIIPDLIPATWYHLKVTAHNNAGSTEEEYHFATRTVAGEILPEMADGVRLTEEDEDEFSFYRGSEVVTVLVALGCLVIVGSGVLFLLVYRRRRSLLLTGPEPLSRHRGAGGDSLRPASSTDVQKNVSNSSSNFLLDNRNFHKPAGGGVGGGTLLSMDMPASELSGDVSPYATSQIPGCYYRDMLNSDHHHHHQVLPRGVYPPLRVMKESRDGTYPGTRKQYTMQRLQRCDTPLDRSPGFVVRVSSADDLHVSGCTSMLGHWPWSSPSASALEQNVPDLLEQHGLESSSSLDLEEEEEQERRRVPRNFDACRNSSRGRVVVAAQEYEAVEDETSFTVLPASPDTKMVPICFRPEVAEYSDTESERDILSRKMAAAFHKTDFPYLMSPLSISPWKH